MIVFVTPRLPAVNVDEFTYGRAPELSKRFCVVEYRDIHRVLNFEATWVFLSRDLCTPEEHQHALDAECKLIAAGRRILNMPSRVSGRLALLDRLHRAGINPFRAFALQDVAAVRLPVIVRSVHHTGRESPLVTDLTQLSTIRDVLGAHPDAMVSEFFDTKRADGLYAKYSVLRIGDRIIPRHVLFSESWCVRKADTITPKLIEEEAAFLNAEVPREVVTAFELGSIDYGRIDYSLRPEGGIVVWEINLDPVLVPNPQRTHPLREPSHQQTAIHALSAFRALL